MARERAKEYDRKAFNKLLRSNGYKVVRKTGSHHIWENAQGDTISMSMKHEPNRMIVRRLIREHHLKEGR